MTLQNHTHSLESVSDIELLVMSKAAIGFLEIVEDAYQNGRPVLLDLIGETPFVQWEHYPPDDLFDPKSGALAFYHAHSPEDRQSTEHGHFHCFVECRDIPTDALPLAKPRKRSGRRLCHVAGVSVDMNGVPTELFVPNQWVTGEWLYSADIVAARARKLALVDKAAARPLRWLGHLLTMFRPQVRRLLSERDEKLGSGRGAGRRARDHAIDVISTDPINIDAQIEAIFAETERRNENSMDLGHGTSAVCGQY